MIKKNSVLNVLRRSSATIRAGEDIFIERFSNYQDKVSDFHLIGTNDL